MRYVIIPECEYSEFERLRDLVDDDKPWSLFRADYSKKLKKAIFGFWDADYIPKEFQPYIVKP